ncbi:MAG: 3-methylcrotonyl-CoA carboxylase, partial [Coxiellaceae bacterium]|nr:3-methylcrotonyl-CoA carboxylase [Coxiellaceae bacterium]
PAPGLTSPLRTSMGNTAVQAARAINYVGAGTVEFLLDSHEQFYFMEMNTRLQVEHPVTECITGFDLVEWQLLVAAGNPLPVAQESIHCHGHAIECRVYAEDPYNGFLPSIGTLDHVHFPNADYLRVDQGYESHDFISQHYDPMIAKVITHADSREHALDDIIDALAATEIIGVKTNIPFLLRILKHRDYQQARMTTHFIDDHKDVLQPELVTPDNHTLLMAAFALRQQQNLNNAKTLVFTDDIHSPWRANSSWRMNTASVRDCSLWWHDEKYPISVNGNIFSVNGIDYVIEGHLNNANCDITINEQRQIGRVILIENRCHVYFNQQHVELLIDHSESQDQTAASTAGQLVAPMPGTVVAVYVANGDEVNAGDPL